MKASPGDRSAFQGHHDALHGLARALNLQTKDGERLADAAARWLKTQGHKVPARRSGHRPEAEAVQESLFRGRSPLAVAIFKALTTPRAGGLLELPEAYGERLWALAKGANHKYLKRVPKAGGGYRYYYRVGHGGGIDSHDAEEKAYGAAYGAPAKTENKPATDLPRSASERADGHAALRKALTTWQAA